MKKRSYRTATALIGVGLALSGACTQSRETTESQPVTPELHPPDAYFPPNVRSGMESMRNAAIEHWRNKGIGNISTRNFVFLEGPATIKNACKGQIFVNGKLQPPKDIITSGDPVSPSYCPTTDKIIINPVNVQFGLPKGEAPDSPSAVGLARMIVSHESTHLFQSREGTYTKLSNVAVETQADCYMGYLVAKNYPEDHYYDTKIMEAMPDNNKYHGRSTNFQNGFDDVQGEGRACEVHPSSASTVPSTVALVQ